jgi:NAD(P)-dependent dehydrogenase (short-subunit alcohol dehydrogenase family)
VALVSGGVRGLGLATARELAARGLRVHVAWRSSRAAAQALEREFAGRVHQADVERQDEARALVAAVLETDGRLDCLVHAVGVFRAGRLDELEPAALRALWENNVGSALLLFGAARAALRASRGAALFFGTAGLAGLRGRGTAAAYTAAKSALLVLVRSWALEEGPHGLRVNMLSPGLIPHEHAAPATLDPALPARVPLGRAGTLEEVARAAAWLVSPEASYVTGTDLEVAGGWLG